MLSIITNTMIEKYKEQIGNRNKLTKLDDIV